NLATELYSTNEVANAKMAKDEAGRGNGQTKVGMVGLAAQSDTTSNHYAEAVKDKGYLCGKPRHRSNSYPSRTTLNLVD
ncbi:hypothetical protein FCV25MIE_33581, partial [Fagus crenata]